MLRNSEVADSLVGKEIASVASAILKSRDVAPASTEIDMKPAIIKITSISADGYHHSQVNDCLHYTRTANGTGLTVKNKRVQPYRIRKPIITSNDGGGPEEKPRQHCHQSNYR